MHKHDHNRTVMKEARRLGGGGGGGEGGREGGRSIWYYLVSSDSSRLMGRSESDSESESDWSSSEPFWPG